MLADRSRQLKAAELREHAAEVAGAQELARRNEISHHAHEGIEQSGPGRQKSGHPIGEAPPADDELQAARDPLLVAKRAPPGSGIGCFLFSSRSRHPRCYRDWSSDVCSSDLAGYPGSPAIWSAVRATAASAGSFPNR